MMASATMLDKEPVTLSDVVQPVQAQVQSLLSATPSAREKMRLVSIARWLRLLLTSTPARWPDVGRIGEEATAVVIGLVETLDLELEQLEQQVSLGLLDWTLIRRHMLLASRRHRLVSLAVAIDDMVHQLQREWRV